MLSAIDQVNNLSWYVLNSDCFKAWDDQTWIEASRMFETLQKMLQIERKDQDVLWSALVNVKKFVHDLKQNRPLQAT